MGEEINPEFWQQFSEELHDEQFRKKFFAALFVDIMQNSPEEMVHKSDL